PGEPHRHDGDRGDARVELPELPDAPGQVRAVVEAGAEHDLGMHPDPAGGQPPHALHQVTADRRRAPQEEVAHDRIGGVDRDVERREPELQDALDLALREVGQRDVVAVQEGEAVVVVLDVEALAEPSRQLVDEAEHALVGAGRDLGRRGRLALEPEPLAPLPPQHDRARLARPVGLDRQRLLARLDVEVDQVSEVAAVDAQEPVPGPEPRALGRPARRHRQDAHPGGRDPLRHQRPPQSTYRGARTRYWSPEAAVRSAVSQISASRTGRTSCPWPITRRATPTVTICTTVLVFPSMVGAGCSWPPVSMISTATRMRSRSRLSTTAVSQNGSTAGNW